MSDEFGNEVAENLLKNAVWEKGHPIPGRAPSKLRKDDYGNTIRNKDYGNRNSTFGWEIDHIVPKADGGTDDLSNLRPLQWEANVKRT